MIGIIKSLILSYWSGEKKKDIGRIKKVEEESRHTDFSGRLRASWM